MAVTFARIGVMFAKMRTSVRRERTAIEKFHSPKKSEQQTVAGLLLYPENRVLCRLGDSEFDDGLGGNLHLLLRLGIEAPSCLVNFRTDEKHVRSVLRKRTETV